jgi:hypothetical protein
MSFTSEGLTQERKKPSTLRLWQLAAMPCWSKHKIIDDIFSDLLIFGHEKLLLYVFYK